MRRERFRVPQTTISRSRPLRRLALTTAAILVIAPVGTAAAEPSTLAILNPANGSSTLDTTPTVNGTTDGTLNQVTVAIYTGTVATGTPYTEENAEATAEDTWTLTSPPLQEGTYTALATEQGELGEPIMSEAVTFTVEAAPVVTVNPGSVTVTAGEAAVFEAAASGTPAPSVQWQVSTDGGATWTNDVGDAGNTTDTLTVAATTGGENGYEYRAVFRNVPGEAFSQPATLAVHTGPLVTGNPTSIAVTAGEAAVFDASASGNPTPTVQWQVSTNGGVTWTNDLGDGGNTTGTLTVAATTGGENGYEYRAVFTNVAGKAFGQAATLTVHTAPVVTGNPTSRGATAGETVAFKASASGNPAPSVQWQVSADFGATWTDDLTDTGNTTGTLTVAAATVGENGYEYRAVFTNVAGTATSNPATLTVKEQQLEPLITESPHDTAVLTGETAFFTAAATGVPAPAVQWEVSTNAGVTWNKDLSDTGNNTDTLVIKGAVLAQNGNEYRAVFTNTAGKVGSEAATLTVANKKVGPQVTVDPSNAAAVVGQPAMFSAEASGVPSPTVRWQVSKDRGATWTDDVTDEGTTSNTLTIPAVSGSENLYEYRAVFTNGAGEARSEPATLEVDTKPVVTVDPISTTVTAGETATFTAAGAGTPAPEVQWEESQDGSIWTAVPGAVADTLTLEGVPLAQNGRRYRALFVNAAGSVTTASATLTVTAPPAPPPQPPTSPQAGQAQPPAASFAWFPAAPQTGEAVSLASTSTDPASPIVAFAWDLAGNGSFVVGSSVARTSFSTPGRHIVRLRVTDAAGRSSVASETIVVSRDRPVLMQPFPVVRIAGSDTASGARLSLVSVQAPVGATITVSCRGQGCPPKPTVRVAAQSHGKAGVVIVAFHRFERSMQAGAVLRIRITKAGEIGKYTSFTIRRGALPTRVDLCLGPTSSKPIQCPSS